MIKEKTHLKHCNQGEYFGTCKYGENDTCPALFSRPLVKDLRECAETVSDHYSNASDLCVEAADRIEMLEASLDLLQRAAEFTKWDDRSDEWSEKIEAAHPTKSGSHDQYRVAMEMVNNRRSKYALVDLINWLLLRAEKAEEWNRQMVEKAASGGTLDGYREMGQQIAALESERGDLKATIGKIRALASEPNNKGDGS